MCHDQSTQLALLKEDSRRLNATMDAIVSRVQLLVDQFHAQNVAQAEMRGDIAHIKGKVDEIEESLKQDFASREEVREMKGWIYRAIGTVLTFVLLAVLSLLKWGPK